MAELIIQSEKIKENIKYLGRYFKERDIHWSLITKVFSGDMDFLRRILTPDVIEHVNSIGDSRLTSLKNLREVNPEMRTIYIKPPAETYAEEVVRFADISLNTSLRTIQALDREAAKQDKVHRVIIMIELGELREGVNRDEILKFYESLFGLANIEVIGIGSNLGCMYGLAPTYDKLLQLSLYRELIAAKFDKRLDFISGGTSITLPMLEQGNLPPEINHFRIGEAAFFGVSPLDNKKFRDLSDDTFEFQANIIELKEKDLVPDGLVTDANIGHTADLNTADTGESSNKAILDFGLLDVDRADIDTTDPNMKFVGMTSDMLVVDIGNNRKPDGSVRYRLGDTISFTPNYLGVARLLNSKFIDKRFV